MSCSLPPCQNQAQCRSLRNICWVSIWGNGFEKQVPYGWYRWHLLMLLGVPGTRGSWNTSPFPEHRMRWMEKITLFMCLWSWGQWRNMSNFLIEVSNFNTNDYISNLMKLIWIFREFLQGNFPFLILKCLLLNYPVLFPESQNTGGIGDSTCEKVFVPRSLRFWNKKALLQKLFPEDPVLQKNFWQVEEQWDSVDRAMPITSLITLTGDWAFFS